MKDTILYGDATEQLKAVSDETVQMCVTSPPYWGLRQYLPDRVKIKQDLSDQQKEYVMSELERLGVFPVDE